MNMTLVDYVVEIDSGGSPNVVQIPSTVIGIEVDDPGLVNTSWDVYTSFDGVAIHQLNGLTITLADSILWVPVNNAEWFKLRCAGPYFALDPAGLDESAQHTFRLYCRGVL